MGRVYTVRAQAAWATAITVLEVTAVAGKPFTVLRAWLSQITEETSKQVGVALLRKTATITGTGVTPVLHNTDSGAAGATAKHTASAEGTDGDILVAEGFNALTGWIYLPLPEERVLAKDDEIIALKFTEAPGAGTWEAGITFEEE
jgi:hypothetical protein